MTVALPARARLLASIVLASLSIALWSAAVHQRFTSLSYPDACDYAQLGRQLLRGEGFTSDQTFPYVLSWLKDHGQPLDPPWPNITRFPLPPLVKAASFGLFGVSDLSAVLPDAAFFVLTVVLCFLLAGRLGGMAAGWSAAVVVAASPTVIGYAVSGLTETGAGLLLVAGASALVALMFPSHDGPRDSSPSATVDAGVGSMRRAAVLGAILGLAYLQRSNLAFAAPPALLVLMLQSSFTRAQRGKLVLVTAAVAAAIVSPWLVRNALFYGSPFLSLTVDRGVAIALLGRDVFYDFALMDRQQVLASHTALLLDRLLDWRWLLAHWSELFGSDMSLLAPVLVASMAVPLGREGRAVRTYFWGTALLTWIAFVPVFHEPRYYQPFAPLAVVLGASAVARVLRLLPGRFGAIALATSCSALALSWVVVDFGREVRSGDSAMAPWKQWIEKAVPADAAVASDVSWIAAWQADRRSVRFYGDVAQLAQLERDYTKVAAVWLTRPSSARFARELVGAGATTSWEPARSSDDGTVLWLATGRLDAGVAAGWTNPAE